MTHENQPAPRSVSQVRLVEDDYFYYMHGRLGMKSDGSFTDEKRHWIPISRLDADAMMENGGQPVGATMGGDFIGTEHGERLNSVMRDGEYPFGRTDRDDQFCGSRVRVRAKFAGDTDWEGTVSGTLDNGSQVSVVGDGKDFWKTIPGHRIEVIERIENIEGLARPWID